MSSRGCRRSLGAGQHALVAASPVPVALVRAGGERPTRAVLALSSVQAKRPSSAGLLAARWRRGCAASGIELVVVAGRRRCARTSSAILGTAADGHGRRAPAGLARDARAGRRDLVIVPGGRNGALATARITRQARRRRGDGRRRRRPRVGDDERARRRGPRRRDPADEPARSI